MPERKHDWSATQLKLAANDSHKVVGIAPLLRSSSAMSLRPSSAPIMHGPDAQSHDANVAADPINSEVPGQQHHGHGMSDSSSTTSFTSTTSAS